MVNEHLIISQRLQHDLCIKKELINISVGNKGCLGLIDFSCNQAGKKKLTEVKLSCLPCFAGSETEMHLQLTTGSVQADGARSERTAYLGGRYLNR